MTPQRIIKTSRFDDGLESAVHHLFFPLSPRHRGPAILPQPSEQVGGTRLGAFSEEG